MGERDHPYRRFYSEYYDIDGVLLNQECEIYGLVHSLVRETHRLMDLVLEARRLANANAPRREGKPYPMIGEDLYNASFDDHPAMLRYYELYDEEVPF